MNMDSHTLFDPPDIKVKTEPEYLSDLDAILSGGTDSSSAAAAVSQHVFIKTETPSSSVSVSGSFSPITKVNNNNIDNGTDNDDDVKPIGVWDVLKTAWAPINKNKERTVASANATSVKIRIENKHLESVERLRMPAEIDTDVNKTTSDQRIPDTGGDMAGPVPVAMFLNTANTTCFPFITPPVFSQPAQTEPNWFDVPVPAISQKAFNGRVPVPVPPAIIDLEKEFTKPVLSFQNLVALAIVNDEERFCTVKAIYDFITAQFPYFQHCCDNWRKLVRHSLTNGSHHGMFRKTRQVRLIASDVVRTCRRGHFWTVNPDKMSGLISSLVSWKNGRGNYKTCMAFPEQVDAMIYRCYLPQPSPFPSELSPQSPALLEPSSSLPTDVEHTMNIHVTNINKLCRLCGGLTVKKKTKVTDYAQPFSTCDKLSSELKSYLDLDVSTDELDKHSLYVCFECEERIKKVMKMKRRENAVSLRRARVLLKYSEEIWCSYRPTLQDIHQCTVCAHKLNLFKG